MGQGRGAQGEGEVSPGGCAYQEGQPGPAPFPLQYFDKKVGSLIL